MSHALNYLKIQKVDLAKVGKNAPCADWCSHFTGVREVYKDQTPSPPLDEALRKRDEEDWVSVRQRLASVILTEHLAYQFTSPLRWIETQDLLFTVRNLERFAEIGPFPILTGMGARALKGKCEAGDNYQSRAQDPLSPKAREGDPLLARGRSCR